MIIQGFDKSSEDGKTVRVRTASPRGRSTLLSVVRVLVILAAVSLIALRVSFPHVERFLPDVEKSLHAAIGQRVSIGSMRAGWRGWTPELVMEDIRLPDSTEDAPHIPLLRVGIGIDLLSLGKSPLFPPTPWEAGAIRTKGISLSGLSLTVVRDAHGSLYIAGTGKPTGLLSWLLRQPRLDLKSAHIHWRDERNEELSFSLRNTHLRLRGDGSGYRILATAFPYQGHSTQSHSAKEAPGTSNHTGGSLSTVADITLDPATLDWSGKVFLHTKDLDLDRFTLLQNVPQNALPIPTAHGVANLGVWTLWDQGQLEYVEGDFTLGRSVLTSADSTAGSIGGSIGGSITGTEDDRQPTDAPAQKAAGFLKLARIGAHDWQLRLHGFELATAEGPWPATDARLGIAWRRNEHGYLVEARHGELSNEDFTARLAGTVQWFDDHGSPDLRLRMAIDDGKLPRLTRYLPAPVLNGPLLSWLRHAFPKGAIEGGEILFHGRPADFPFPNGEGALEARLRTSSDTALEYTHGWPPLEALASEAVFENQRLTVTANTGSAHGAEIREVTAEIPDITAETPMLTVNGHVADTLDQGLSFLRTGPLADRYAHRIAGIEGSGKYGLDLRLQLPLSDNGPYREVEAQGTVTFLDSRIEIDPSALAAETGTRGNDDLRVSFHGVNGALAFTGRGISGENITARYRNLPVTLHVGRTADWKHATRFAIHGLTTDSLLAYPLLKDALQKAPPSVSSPLGPLLARLTDKASWQFTLDLPDSWGQKDNTRSARVGLATTTLATTLDDTGTPLPAPLDQPFQARMMLSQKGQDQGITVRFGPDSNPKLTATFAPVESSGKGSGRWRAAARLGAGPARLPTGAGLRMDGHAAHLSLDGWLALLDTGSGGNEGWSETLRLSDTRASTFRVQIPPGPAPAASPKGDEPTPETDPEQKPIQTIEVLEQFHIRADEFTVWNRTLRNIRLQAGPAADGSWYIQIQGDDAEGYIHFPRTNASGANEAVVADFARLRLPPADKPPTNEPPVNHKADEAPEPWDIPPIRFTCRDFTYHARPMGNLQMKLAPARGGIALERLQLGSKKQGIEIEGHGAWTRSSPSGPAASRLRMSIRARDLGKLLSTFGYEGKVAKKGKTRLELDGAWPGPPAGFQLEKASGVIEMKITDGRLLAIEPGATGRVFGLLSITLLPRRLLLDFRDLYQEGFIYDRMEGKFTISEGNAETKDFAVEGPSAHIHITGTTGLVDEKYDQIATVIPKLASAGSIPLAAVGGIPLAAVGGIPLAAIGIAQYLLDEPFFDKVFAYRYNIAGTWSDPKIELIQEDSEAETESPLE